MSIQNDIVLNKLSNIRKSVDNLNIPKGVYAFLYKKAEKFFLVETGGKYDMVDTKIDVKDLQDVFGWLENHEKAKNIKIVACGLENGTHLDEFGAKLWSKNDIVPIVIPKKMQGLKPTEKALYVKDMFNKSHIARVILRKYNEVLPAELVLFEDYENTSDAKVIKEIKEKSEILKNKRIIFISATPQGGGVALMRHALIRLYNLLGLNISWYILEPNENAFEVIKTRFHNILQDVAGGGIRLTKKDESTYLTWIKENAEILEQPIKDSDLIVVDDPQPSALIPYIKKLNPKAKLVFRSHIQLDRDLMAKKGSAQREVWEFLWQFVKYADIFVSHPVEQFVPYEVDPKKLVMMPPTTDQLDGLNRDLNEHQSQYYRKLFDKIILMSNQTPLDRKRPYLVQIARFDPSKGIPDVLEAYRLVRERLEREGRAIPQLVMAGHGSIDDPDGSLMLALMEEQIQSAKYRSLRHDVKRVLLPHVDQLLNVIVRDAKIALQLSYKEGYEIKVSESLIKGKPIIVYRTGGIPLQVKDRENAFLVETGNIDEVYYHLYNLLTDKKLYTQMSKEASKAWRDEIFTTGNALNWMRIFCRLLDK